MAGLSAREKVALHEAALAEFLRKLYIREIDLKAGERVKQDLSPGSAFKAAAKQNTDQATWDIKILRQQIAEHELRLEQLRPLAEEEESAEEEAAEPEAIVEEPFE